MGDNTINSICFHCIGCDKEISPHKIKVPHEEGLFMWETMCAKCRAQVPRWNPSTGQWNNDGSSIRYNCSDLGDGLGSLLHELHNGGSTGGSFNSF